MIPPQTICLIWFDGRIGQLGGRERDELSPHYAPLLLRQLPPPPKTHCSPHPVTMMAFGPTIDFLLRRSSRSIVKSHTAAAASASTNALAVVFLLFTTSSTSRCFSNNSKKNLNDKEISNLDLLHIPEMQDEVLIHQALDSLNILHTLRV